MINLRKIRVNDIAPIVRAVYAEAGDAFLGQYGTAAGNGLDACVSAVIENTGSARFFRIETDAGVLMGFFSLGKVDGVNALLDFHIRNVFCSVEYLQAFWSLIAETYNNSFFTSVGALNYGAMPVITDKVIGNPLLSTGRNVQIILNEQ